MVVFFGAAAEVSVGSVDGIGIVARQEECELQPTASTFRSMIERYCQLIFYGSNKNAGNANLHAAITQTARHSVKRRLIVDFHPELSRGFHFELTLPGCK
jgi:hypothetical protein